MKNYNILVIVALIFVVITISLKKKQRLLITGIHKEFIIYEDGSPPYVTVEYFKIG